MGEGVLDRYDPSSTIRWINMSTIEYVPIDPSKRPTTTKYKPGGARSIEALDRIGFDPIQALVMKFMELEDEAVHLKERRTGKVNVINANTGKILNMRDENLHGVYDKQITIAKELLRYKYGRVPETPMNDIDQEVGGLTITLT